MEIETEDWPMVIGEINKLKTLRKSDLGYMLSDGNEEVLMHFREATEELADEVDVDVFLYYDKKGRLCATMQKPYVTVSKPGFVKVVNIIPDLGVFIDNNCSKDFLVSKDYLPYNALLWPQIGDIILCSLKIKPNEVMVAKPLNRFEISEISKKVKYEIGEKKTAYVCRISERGYGMVTNDLEYIYVPFKMTRKEYRLGEMSDVTIITNATEGFYLGSLIEIKEKMIDTDMALIIDFLKKNGGKMKYTAKSSAEEIELVFKMSRKAFKRALGTLYKEKIILTNDLETTLL